MEALQLPTSMRSVAHVDGSSTILVLPDCRSQSQWSILGTPLRVLNKLV